MFRYQEQEDVRIVLDAHVGSGFVAMDNLKLVCGAEFSGECACQPGYINMGNVTHLVERDYAAQLSNIASQDCQVDPNELPEEEPDAMGVDTCLPGSEMRNTTLHRYLRHCRNEPVNYVCSDGTLYKNEVILS